MNLLPLFLNLTGRAVVLVGGGRVAAAKLSQLVAAGARVRVVAPDISAAIRAAAHPNVELAERPFDPSDLDEAWLVVAAATPAVNREVAMAAAPRRLFVNAVDDPPNASAFLGGVVRRDGVTIAISTSGDAPALTALVREGVDALLPRDLARWMETARKARIVWRRDGVPMDARKPLLLRALNTLYRDARLKPIARLKPRVPVDQSPHAARLKPRVPVDQSPHAARLKPRAPVDQSPLSLEREASAERVPWLNAPEDSWP